MRNILVLTLTIVFSIVTSFANEMPETTFLKKKRKIDNKCMSTDLNTEIVEIILSANTIKNTFQLNTRKNKNIKLISNQYIGAAANINLNFRKVLVVDNPSRYPAALNVDFSNIDCSNDSLSFIIKSRIEGVVLTGGLRKVGELWEVKVFTKHNLK